LNSLISTVSHINIALRINRYAVNRVELTLGVSSRTPGFDELAVLVKLGHPGIAIAIGDIDKRPAP